MDERRTIIVGSPGSGKSHALQWMAETPPDWRAAWLVDPLGNLRDPQRASAHAHLVRPAADDMRPTEAPFYEFLDDVCTEAMRRGNVLVLVDEVSLACFHNHAPHALVELCLRGRHRGCGYVLAGQTHIQIPTQLRAVCNEYLVFKTSEPAHLRHLAGIGADPYRVARLERGQFCHVVNGAAHYHEDILSPCEQPTRS